jgi:hypothetical protein
MKRLRPSDADELPAKALKCGERCVRFDASAASPAASADVWQRMIDDFLTHFSDEYM